jgi:hypothetical protein
MVNYVTGAPPAVCAVDQRLEVARIVVELRVTILTG